MVSIATALRVGLFLGATPFLLSFLHFLSGVYQRDVISLSIGNDTTKLLLFAMDKGFAPFLVADKNSKDSNKLRVVARYLPFRDSKTAGLYNYQEITSYLRAPLMSTSKQQLVVLTDETNQRLCLQYGKNSEPLQYCQDKATTTLTQPFATIELLGKSFQRDTSRLHISRPGLVAYTAQPFERIYSSIMRWRSQSTDSATSSSSLPFRRNPAKSLHSNSQPHEETPLMALLRRPAFLFLATLQLALAFIYWNRKIPPSAAAQDYSTIMNQPSNEPGGGQEQLWRLLTGCLAHFDVWHIGLNLSAFYNISQHLEGSIYSSLEYLGLNLSLMACVGAIWLGLQRYTLPPEKRGPTVGYSGVLFALSVISTLQQPPGTQTCPIPFFEKACFSTVRLWGVPFSWSPLIQLIIAQVLLPRVSWTGHLAGVLVGFAFIWGWLPFLAFPSLYWPLLHLVFLRQIRRVIGNVDKLHYASIQFAIGAAMLLGSMILAGGIWNPLNLAFSVLMVFDKFAVASERNMSVVRAHAVACVLNMITLSISVSGQAVVFGIGKDSLSIAMQILQWCFCFRSILHIIPWIDENSCEGIFAIVLGPILSPGPTSSPLHLPCFGSFAGQQHHAASTPSSSGASMFPGSGRTLGSTSGSRRSIEGTSRLSRIV